MRRSVPFLLLLFLFPATAGAVVKRPPVHATATGTGGAAASVDPYATKTAIDVLRHGGNAVDAAIAAASVLGVVEPYSSGIGGGGFMVIRTPKGKITEIDGREFAPKAFKPTSFLKPGTKKPYDFDTAVTSGLSVGIPGTPATWTYALKHFGTRGLAASLRPSEKLARKGFVVDRTLHTQTVMNKARFKDFPATAKLYLPHGKPIKTGSTLRNPDLANSLELFAKHGFYRGALANAIVDSVRHPATTKKVPLGLMSTGDLAAYRALQRDPTATDYRGHTIYGAAPPSSGGTTVGEILNIMEAFGTPTTSSATEDQREIEAERLAYADRGQYLGDPKFVKVPVACLLSQAFADARQALIGDGPGKSPAKAGKCGDNGAAAARSTEGPNTTHLTVVDKHGMIVSYTFTIEQTGGSGMVVPGRGFLLNNELTDFGFTPGTANSPAPRKRPRSSISPTIVEKDGAPELTVGSPGGATIITTVAQILLDRYERGLTLPQSIADARFSEENLPEGDKVIAEPGFIKSADGKALKALGYKFMVPDPAEIGAATGVEFLGGGELQAAAEPKRRGGGSAMVVKPR